MRKGTRENRPAIVCSAKETKQAGEIWSRWLWVKPEVWTERMLTALEQGVKGGKWYSLMDKVSAPGTLLQAWYDVRENHGAPGVDHQTIERFESRLEENLNRISEELKDGTYQVQAILRKWIDKPGSPDKRPLGIPTVRDRVVQTAMKYALEPIFERDFAPHSYGFRPKRGCKDALRRVAELLKQGYSWAVDADFRKYFDTIPREPLRELVEQKVSDGAMLNLVEAYLKQGVMEGLQSWTPEEGTPQGAVISPLLANIYLDGLDHFLAEQGYELVRYADDFVVLCRTEAEAQQALQKIQEWVERAGLQLHPEKTRVVDSTQRGGFDFLGYHFERGKRWPRKKSMEKFRNTIREKTHRNNPHRLEAIIEDVNGSVKGWFEYFKHSNRWTFPRQDSWIRGRLRSILRKRQGKKGRGRGTDHQRWPNAFFAKQGLFSMQRAHAEACQSAQR